MVDQSPPWICCQLGAREHYAIPRALGQQDQLMALITDAWVHPESWVAHLPNSQLKGRYHADLEAKRVYHFTPGLIAFELQHKFVKRSVWDVILRRNHWFQRCVTRQISQLEPFARLEHPPVVFAYSYAALEIFRYAKQRNWFTVLGQIDPGPVEESIVQRLHQESKTLNAHWQPAPEQYWHTWWQECSLADQIVVNSAWSKQALHQVGVEEDKLRIIPLAYQAPEQARDFQRFYPETFSSERPLRVLFLGQINLRKGILPLLQAVDRCEGKPVELWMVGPCQIDIPQRWLVHPQIRWFGAVLRSEAVAYYKQTDVFILPTYSDGFAITQLEAATWRLPLIVSRNCGDVVSSGINGLILDPVNAHSIEVALDFCWRNASALRSMSEKMDAIHRSYSLANLNSWLCSGQVI